MKGYLTIIKYYPDNNRLEGFGIGLIMCSEDGTKSYIKFSEPRFKRINSAFGFNKSKLLEFVIENYSSRNYDYKSLEYLSAYENGNIRFTKPDIIVTQNLQERFEMLYNKYVADYNEFDDSENSLLKRAVPQKIGRKLQSTFRKNRVLNSRLNIGYDFQNNSLGKFLIGNPKIDFIGGNGSIFCGEILNLSVNEESVQKNLFKTITLFEAIKETYQKHNRFEPHDCKILVLKEHADKKENAEYMDKISNWHKKVGYDLIIKNSIEEFEQKILTTVEDRNIKKYEDWDREIELSF